MTVDEDVSLAGEVLHVLRLPIIPTDMPGDGPFGIAERAEIYFTKEDRNMSGTVVSTLCNRVCYVFGRDEPALPSPSIYVTATLSDTTPFPTQAAGNIDADKIPIYSIRRYRVLEPR